MTINHRLENVVLGFEVIIDVSAIHTNGIDDVSERCAVIAVFIEQRLGALNNLGTGFLAFVQLGIGLENE